MRRGRRVCVALCIPMGLPQRYASPYRSLHTGGGWAASTVGPLGPPVSATQLNGTLAATTVSWKIFLRRAQGARRESAQFPLAVRRLALATARGDTA